MTLFSNEEQKIYDSLKVPDPDYGQREQYIYNVRLSKIIEEMEREESEKKLVYDATGSSH